MHRSQRSRRTPSGPTELAGPDDDQARKEQALRQAEDALWKIPRSLDGIKRSDFNPVALALQMMDGSSLGKSYGEFHAASEQLNESLDGIVNEYYGGFNDSILTFSGLQERIQDASGSVNVVKGNLQRVRRMIVEERGSLDQLYTKSKQLGAIVAILRRLEEAGRVREEIAAFAADKKYLAAAGRLVQDMQFVFDPQLDAVEALSGQRQQLEKEKRELQQRIVDELHSHVYLKSPYCERRMGGEGDAGERPGRARIRRARGARGAGGAEDGAEGSAEADSFAFVEMLLESLAALGGTGEALQEVKSSISLELSRLIDGVVAEAEERGRAQAGGADAGAEVLRDFARMLFARLEAVLEYHDYVLDVAARVDGGARAYALGDVWAAVRGEVVALLRGYLVAEDARGAGADAGGAGMRDLFHMERGDVGGVDALYAPVAARFADLAAGAPDRRRVLTAPAVIDEYADVQNSLQHKLLAAPDVEHAPALLGMALAFTRRVAPMLAAAGVSVSGASGAGASLSPAVRRSVGAELSPPPHDSAADEYLHAFFANAFLPHAEAQAARAFDALTGASDAFDADPDARLGGRPVFRSAAALVPQLARLGALLSRLGAFGGGGGDGWAALLQLAARYYERCLALFRDTVRSPEGQTYLSVRWSESLDMMQLFDRRMRNDGDALREIRAEEALKADRSLNPYELVFDGKRLAAVAQLHQTLEWLRAQLAPVLAGAADCARVLGRFQSLAVQCLMVLRIEVRVHCMHYLDLALREGDYALARDAVEPEPYVQALNADLAAAEERLAACLPADKLALVFAGVSVLMAHTLVANARHIRRFNAAGCRKMARNILALQQNLTNIALPEEGGLDAARRYYELYDLGADGILRHIAEHGAEFALDDYRRMLAFVCSGSADAAAPSPGRASSLLEASQADQYEAHVLRLRELLAAPPIPARK